MLWRFASRVALLWLPCSVNQASSTAIICSTHRLRAYKANWSKRQYSCRPRIQYKNTKFQLTAKQKIAVRKVQTKKKLIMLLNCYQRIFSPPNLKKRKLWPCHESGLLGHVDFLHFINACVSFNFVNLLNNQFDRTLWVLSWVEINRWRIFVP